MFNVGDNVIYGNTGICIIEDIRLEDFLGKKETYYILRPLQSKGSMIFCPVNNVKVTMRKVITKEELDRILTFHNCPTVSWIENDHERRDCFSAILKRCDTAELSATLRLLYKRKDELSDTNKKLHASDEKALADCERILFGEISHILSISIEEAADMFKSKIK
ncbi:MAG: hypothetical protein E7578_02105 [Ruminococcaceae bacterium]|nr:hypothetical protein [Oscillospiraceae bacterium]